VYTCVNADSLTGDSAFDENRWRLNLDEVGSNWTNWWLIETNEYYIRDDN